MNQKFKIGDRVQDVECGNLIGTVIKSKRVKNPWLLGTFREQVTFKLDYSDDLFTKYEREIKKIN